MRDRSPPLFLGYLALQVLIVVGVTPGVWPDTETYLHLSLTGADTRLPTVPLLYKVFPTDSLRMWAQVVLAASAWWTLASVASAMVVDRRVRIGLRVVLLMIGLAAPVSSWNSQMLSESTAISLTALLIAAWLNYAKARDTRAAGWVVAAVLAWTFTRQPHVFMTAGMALAVAVVCVHARGSRRSEVALAVALAVISVVGFVELHRNQTLSRASVGAIVQLRVLPNRAWTSWFVAHGMPYSPSIARMSGVPFHWYTSDPRFVRWLNTDAINTYLRFMALHPKYTFIDPLPYFPGEQASLKFQNRSPFASLEPNPTPAMLSPVVNYGRHRNVLPSVVDRSLFDQGEIGDILLVGLTGAALCWIGYRRYGADRRLVVPAIVVFAAVPQGYILWWSGGETLGELDRLSMVIAVSVRVGLWLILAFGIDRLLSQSSRSVRMAEL